MRSCRRIPVAVAPWTCRQRSHGQAGSAALAVIVLAGFTVGASCQTASSDAPEEASRTEDQKVILVTGSTGGLGAEVARRLAAGGAHVIVHGRNRARGEALVAEIEAGGVGSAAFYAADLADLDAVRHFADEILRDYERLDVLVNNAGIWLTDGERRVSADGHELHFAVNYLAGFVLTRRLLPLLRKGGAARVVNVASSAQQPVDFEDVMLEGSYSPGRAYAQSKLAQVTFTLDLAEELAHTEITVVALHPATLMDTQMVRDAGVRPRSTVDEGADAVMNLITAPGLESGQYFNGLSPARANDQAYDPVARERLRLLSQELAGLR
jgi:NAD(P)-dependent dehydrogenase (short-subunit alcohol dehydrogenase family)